MKRFLVAILCFIMGCVGLVGCKEDTTPVPEPTPVVDAAEYTITYFAIIDGTKTSIPMKMKIDNAQYPSAYRAGEKVVVDMLQDYTEGTTTYDFGGWYTDVTLTEKTNGEFEAGIKGNIVLYAKVTKSVIEPTEDPTITYIAVFRDEAKVKTTGSIPMQMYKDNGKYPIEYVEGETTKIDELKNWSDTDNRWKYTFVKWYTSAECEDTQEFSGTVDEQQTGGLVLYALIDKAVIPEEPADDDGNWTKHY